MRLVLGCLSSLLIWIVWLIHKKTQRKRRAEFIQIRLPIEAAPVAVVTVTGHLGSFLSRVNGPAKHLQDCQSDWIGKNGNLVILRPVF